MTHFNLYENHESEENNFSRSARDEKDNRDRVNRLAGVPRRWWSRYIVNKEILM